MILVTSGRIRSRKTSAATMPESARPPMMHSATKRPCSVSNAGGGDVSVALSERSKKDPDFPLCPPSVLGVWTRLLAVLLDALLTILTTEASEVSSSLTRAMTIPSKNASRMRLRVAVVSV